MQVFYYIFYYIFYFLFYFTIYLLFCFKSCFFVLIIYNLINMYLTEFKKKTLKRNAGIVLDFNKAQGQKKAIVKSLSAKYGISEHTIIYVLKNHSLYCSAHAKKAECKWFIKNNQACVSCAYVVAA